jgi:hypothetical protein
MNVQIYYHRASEDLQRIPQEKKREIFNAGLLSTVTTVKELKTLILDLGYFGVTKIDESGVCDGNGTHGANFELYVDSGYQPPNGDDIYCLFSTVSRVFFNDQPVTVNPIVTVSTIPKNGVTKVMDDAVKRKIKQLIDLFGRGSDFLGSIVTDDDIEAVQSLESIVR